MRRTSNHQIKFPVKFSGYVVHVFILEFLPVLFMKCTKSLDTKDHLKHCSHQMCSKSSTKLDGNSGGIVTMDSILEQKLVKSLLTLFCVCDFLRSVHGSYMG